MNRLTDNFVLHETMQSTFLRSPTEALERTFAEHAMIIGKEGGLKAFMLQTRKVLRKDTKHYQFDFVSFASLKSRKYCIEFQDGAVSIFWLDEFYDPFNQNFVRI